MAQGVRGAGVITEQAPIQARRTYLPSHVVRRATYDRLVPQGSDSGYLHWLQVRKNEFERLFPHHAKKGDEGRRAFDRWLEAMK